MKRLLSFLDALSCRSVANIQMKTSSWKLKILDQEERFREGVKYLSSINGSCREEQKDSYPLKRTQDGTLDRVEHHHLPVVKGRRIQRNAGKKRWAMKDGSQEQRAGPEANGRRCSRKGKGTGVFSRRRTELLWGRCTWRLSLGQNCFCWVKLISDSYFFNKKLSLAVLKLLCHL